MKKIWINFWIDLAMFLDMVGLVAIGVMIKWALPPGSGGRHGGSRFVQTVWGMTRHEWGDVHFWMGVVLSVLLIVHIILHWRWIVCRFKALWPGSKSGDECAAPEE